MVSDHSVSAKRSFKGLFASCLVALMVCVGSVSVVAVDYDLATDIGNSARMIGLGNIQGFGKGASVVFENPAALFRVDNTSVSLFTSKIIDEVLYNNIAISAQLPFGTVAFGYHETSVLGFANTYWNSSLGLSGRPDVSSYFDYRDAIYKIGYQYQYSDHISLGTAATYFSKSFAGFGATGFNVDLGAVYTQERYEISVVGQNLFPNSKVTYDTGTEVIPFVIVTSGKYQYSEQISVYGQYKMKSSLGTKSFGVMYEPKFLELIWLSFGYKEYLALEQVENRYVVGMGLELGGLHFHYAYENGDNPVHDHNNYFSMNLNF